MKKLLVLLLCLFLNGQAAAHDCVPESPSPPAATALLGLYKPNDNACGWGLRWNQNADTLDSIIPRLSGTNSFNGLQTFNGGAILGPGQNIPRGMRLNSCILIKELNATLHDNLQFDIVPYAVTLESVSCTCIDDACTTPPCCGTGPTFTFADQAGGAISLAGAMSCSIDNTATWFGISGTDPERLLAIGEGPRVSTTTAGTAGDTVLVCVRYIVD